MKKRIVTLLLTLTILGLAAGCGEKKSEEDKKETTKTEQAAEEEFVLTNQEGKVVAADVENLADYITLGEYKNLEVEEKFPKQKITDEDVENSIHYNMLRAVKQVEVTQDRPVKNEDTVNIDYTGYMDGKEFEGGSAKGENLL